MSFIDSPHHNNNNNNNNNSSHLVSEIAPSMMTESCNDISSTMTTATNHDQLIDHHGLAELEDQSVSMTKAQYRSNLIKTILLSLSFILLGFSICSLGPSLLKLSANTGEAVEKMGIVFTVRGVGYVLTAVSVGFILDKFSFYSSTSIYVPKHRVGLYLLKRMEKTMVVVGILLMALGMFVTPLLHSFLVLVLINVLIGVGCGLVDVTSNILLCWIWGDAVNPYMQTLHFCFGVGALIFPLMLQGGDMMFVPIGTKVETRFWNALSVAYYPSAVSMLLVALMFIPFSFEKVASNPTAGQDGEKSCVMDDETNTNLETPTEANFVSNDYDEGVDSPTPLPYKGRFRRYWSKVKSYVRSMDWKQICVCLLTGAALLLYVGSEVGYGGLIYTYLLMKRKEEFEKTASLLTSMFWLSFSLGRLISIPISKYVSAATMLIGDLVFALLGLIALAIWTHPVVIWIATVVIGFAMASQYPATLVIPTGHLNMKVSGLMTSVMVICGSVGEMIIPAILARFISHLLYMLLGIIGFATLIYAVLLFGFKKNAPLTATSTAPSTTGEPVLDNSKTSTDTPVEPKELDDQ